VAAIAAAAPVGVEYGLPDAEDDVALTAAAVVEAARAEAAPAVIDRGAFTVSMAGSGWVVKAPCTRCPTCRVASAARDACARRAAATSIAVDAFDVVLA
jgi:hypothetical protein